MLPGAIENIQPEEYPEEVTAKPTGGVQYHPNGFANFDAVDAIMNPYTIKIIQE